MTITPEQAFILLEGQPSPLRDKLRTDWLKTQRDDDVMHFLGACLWVFLWRHPQHGAQLQLMLAEMVKETQAALQAATS